MLDKAIEHGKENRKPYRKSKRFDRSCRNHGSCPYCKNNRIYHNIRAEEEAESKIKEYLEEYDVEEEEEGGIEK